MSSKSSNITRRNLIKGSALAAGVSVVGGCGSRDRAADQGAETTQGADLALVNGKILTLDDKDSIVSALSMRSGRIVEVGNSVGRATRTIDLKGATVIPGLIDTHHHIYWAIDNPGKEARDIELARSIKELLQAISARAKTVPAGQFITCNGGWTHKSLVEKRVPTLAELDEAAPDHPVWIVETQSEAAWVDPKNSFMLPALTNRLGLDFFQKQGVKIDATAGTVPWLPSTAALQKLDSEEDRINAAIDFSVGLGATMIHDFGNGHAPDPSLDMALRYVVDLWRAQKLKLRFRLRGRAPGTAALKARMVNGINRLGDDVLRLNGFGEGLGERTDASFIEQAKLVAQYGWSAHVHSVSLEEHKKHIAAYQQANAVRPLKDLRWSLAHGNSLTPELLQTLKELGVGVTAESWPYSVTVDDARRNPLGPPWRTLLDSGIHLGTGSDGSGAADFNPWRTIYFMVSGRNSAGDVINAGQTLTRMEALKVHTKGGAWHSFDEHHLGSLEAGKYADLAVLSDDMLTIPEDDLRRLTATLTLQGGKVVHGA